MCAGDPVGSGDPGGEEGREVWLAPAGSLPGGLLVQLSAGPCSSRTEAGALMKEDEPQLCGEASLSLWGPRLRQGKSSVLLQNLPVMVCTCRF